MKKILFTILLATACTVHADSDWVAPFFGGVFLGNAIARPYYPQPNYQYFYPPQYYVAPPVYVQPPVYYQNPNYYRENHRNHHHRHHDD